jgi:ribosomal protein S18 acetylase RimI-like enzyme
MTLTDRAAAEDDRNFVRETHHAAYEDAVTRQFGRWDVAEQDGFFDRSWDPARMRVLLLDGEPCGYCVVEDRTDNVQVQELVVHPRYQGKGVGTEVLARAQRLAAERSVPVRLGTFHTNRARELYERVGFRVVGETETHVLMEWTPEPSIG